MALPWLSFQAGIRIRVCFGMVRALDLDLALGLDSLAASAGVGTIGDTIGTTTAEECVTTTTPTFRTAGPSSIVVTFVRIGRTSIMPSIDLAAAAQRLERIPEPSAGSITAELREATRSADSPALEASTAEAFTAVAAEAFTAAAVAAIDSSYEVIQL